MVIFSWQLGTEGYLDVLPGDRVTLRYDGNTITSGVDRGWLYCERHDGSSRWLSAYCVRKPGSVFVVVTSWQFGKEGYLDVLSGDLVTLLYDGNTTTSISDALSFWLIGMHKINE